MKKEDFLIEVGVEELPHSYIGSAAEQLKKKLESLFNDNGIGFDKNETFYTPRRIAVLFKKVANFEKRTPVRIYGPTAEVAFDSNGEPTKAIIGFLKAYKKEITDIKICEKKGKKVCYIEKMEKPRRTQTIIRTALPSILSSLTFPKRMRWEESGFEFARPIRWLVLLFGSKSIRVKVAGVVSSNKSYTPRFVKGTKIVISKASLYEKTMMANHIIPSFEKRKRRIKNGIAKLLKEGESIVKDEELFNEVVNLVEYPTVFKGQFDKIFLTMPQAVVITAMREHQRYFVIERKDGKLEPNYIGVLNTNSKNLGDIIANNNRVLRARLNDAKFYWDEDIKIPLNERVNKLKQIEWHEGLGSVFDKTTRLVLFSIYLSRVLGKGEIEVIKRGALLSKTDLLTKMIKDGKEFTKLEGIIGSEYALISGETEKVASIIKEHYLPRFPEDSLPSTIDAAIVSVCDRFDTLVGNLIAGNEPSGSEDPYGLRRCASGLVRIIYEFKMRFSLKEVVYKSISLYESQMDLGGASKKKDILYKHLKQFLTIRVNSFLLNKNVRYDLIDSVLSTDLDNIYDAIERIETLNRWKANEVFDKLISGYHRVANILKDSDENTQDVIAEELFDCDAEIELWKHYKEIENSYRNAINMNKSSEAIKYLLSFRPYIDNFFDSCLVMTKDIRKRNNRIALLSKIKKLFGTLADFSLVVTQGESGKETK